MRMISNSQFNKKQKINDNYNKKLLVIQQTETIRQWSFYAKCTSVGIASCVGSILLTGYSRREDLPVNSKELKMLKERERVKLSTKFYNSFDSIFIELILNRINFVEIDLVIINFEVK